MIIDIQKLQADAQSCKANLDHFGMPGGMTVRPEVLLELIAEIGRLQEKNVYWIDQANSIARGRHIARTERDQLKAENDSLRQRLAVPSDVLADCEALRLENEALRKALTYIRDSSDEWHLCEKAGDALADSRKDAAS